jgi:hypothetical protein
MPPGGGHGEHSAAAAQMRARAYAPTRLAARHAVAAGRAAARRTCRGAPAVVVSGVDLRAAARAYRLSRGPDGVWAGYRFSKI